MISDFLGYLENDKEAKEMFETKWGAKYEQRGILVFTRGRIFKRNKNK